MSWLAASITLRPVAVEPVKEIFAISGWAVSAPPRSLASAMMFITPGGKASFNSAPSRNVASGVVGAGFTTTVLPASSAGGIFEPSVTSGKFHGTIRATTPSGRRRDVT